MKDKEEMISRLIKKKSKINMANRDKACKLIDELYDQNNDEKMLVGFLFQGGPIVASHFIKNYYRQIEPQKQLEIANSIINELGIVDEKLSKSGTGFAIVTALFKSNTKEKLMEIFAQTVRLAESGSGFTTNLCATFNKHLLVPAGKKILALDYSSWSKIQTGRFLRFIKATEVDMGKKVFAEEIEVWIETYIELPREMPKKATNELTKEKTIEGLNNQPLEKPQVKVATNETPKLEKEKSQADELMEKLLQVTAEMEKLFDMVFAKNITMDKLQARI